MQPFVEEEQDKNEGVLEFELPGQIEPMPLQEWGTNYMIDSDDDDYYNITMKEEINNGWEDLQIELRPELIQYLKNNDFKTTMPVQ